MTPSSRNSLMADVLDEVAHAAEIHNSPWLAELLKARAKALRSTLERAEQPAGGLLPLYIWRNETDGECERSPEAEAVIAAARKWHDADDQVRRAHAFDGGQSADFGTLEQAQLDMSDALAALDRKTGGGT